MARIRSIKPEFWTSEQLAECSTNARLLFIGIWTFSDDGGVHPDSPKRLKMEVFPADAFTAEDVAAMVDELVTAKLIQRFSAEGQLYLWVTGWHHQKIDRPTLRHPRPPLDESSSNTRRASVEGAASPHPRSRVESSRVEGSGSNNRSIDSDRSTGGDERQASDTRGLAEHSSNNPVESSAVIIDAAAWQSHRERLNAVGKLVGNGRPLADRDRETVARCVFVISANLPAGALDEITSRVGEAIRRGEKRRPVGYFKQAVINACNTAGVDFHAASAALAIPDDFLRPRPQTSVENPGGLAARRPVEAAEGRKAVAI
jgi:hypothetical protein